MDGTDISNVTKKIFKFEIYDNNIIFFKNHATFGGEKYTQFGILSVTLLKKLHIYIYLLCLYN